MPSTIFIPTLAALLGMLYGYLFTRQQVGLFDGSLKGKYFLFLLPLIRLSIISFIIYYLLHIPVLLSILSLGIFISSWWAVIVVLKERLS